MNILGHTTSQPLRKGPQPQNLAARPSEEERELDLWVRRYQPELGLLQSPPLGVPGPKADKAQDYVRGIVRQLAGERLQEAGIEWRVEIFSGDQPQLGLDDSTSQERAWEARHPDKPWPIRSWLEAPKEGSKPLYRLAVSQGLLESLQTREEMAFVVAHQLHRLLEHHAQDPDNHRELKVAGKSWLESGSFQLQNDAAALAMMTGANLNPQGALGALNRLYSKFAPSYPKDDQKAALAAASAIQEHEGVRISALQLQVENLRRSGHPATSQPVQAIPQEVVAPALGDYQVKLENFPLFQKSLNQAATALAGEETPAWMFSSALGSNPLEMLSALRPNPEEYEAAILGVCQHLQSSLANPQHRLHGFLRLTMAMDGQGLPETMSPEGQETIRQFLAQNSNWSSPAFLATLEREDRSLHRDFVRKVALNPTFQAIVAPLDSMKPLVEAVPALFCRQPEGGQFDIEALPAFLSANNGPHRQGDSLRSNYNQASFALLQSQDPQQLARQSDQTGHSVALLLANDLRRVDSLSAQDSLELLSALAPIEQAAHAVREENALLRLRPPLAQPEHLTTYLNELFASEAGGDFSDEFQQRLPALLLDVVRSCNHQPDLVFDYARPQELEPGLQQRLVAMLATSAPPEQAELRKFLSRSWPHELRVSGHSPRREWTPALARNLQSLPKAELLESLTRPDHGQHSGLLRETLLQGYGLGDAALPDTSHASLAALAERAAAGEFRPRPESYQDPAAYQRAQEAYQARLQGMQEVSRFVAPVESRQVLAPLAILGHDAEVSRRVAARLQPAEFVAVLEGTESALERARLVRQVCGDHPLEIIGTDAGAFLLDGFLAVERNFKEIDRFYELARRTVAICPPAIEARGGVRQRLADALHQRLQKLEPEALQQWLGREFVLSTLKPEQAADHLLKLLEDKLQPGVPIEELAGAMRQLESTYALKEKHGLAYVLVRDSVTEKARLQPATLPQVFPQEETSPLESLRQFRPQLAALSGLIAMTRNHPPEVQLATLEYLMGRRNEMPEFLEKASEAQSLGPITQGLRNARETLAEAELPLRVVVANSFLAGPNGLLKDEAGRETVLNYFLAGVPAKALKMARPMTQAILASQGDADSLAVAVVLGQRPKNGGAPLTDADILSRVFDSYGVPGVKMKQYLAFTSQFEHYREAFEDAQDAANPLNYYETLSLLRNRFGDEWPEDFEIDRVLGSGSVNVAIRYKNKTTGKREVVSLGRQDIEEQTRYDFDRFRRFVDALTSNPEGQANFGFIKGLTGIIAASVELEFDKESAMAVQKQAFETYRHQFADGWTLRSIDAYQVKNLGLFMEEARGVTARKTLTQKPELYREAMRHMARAEFNLLKGRDASNNLWPRPNFANPDIHDGQVLIDEASKTATVLDFGQAVPITNKERALGLDLLTVLGKLSTAKGASKRLNKRFLPHLGKGEGITADEVRALWKTPKKMDMFIRLLALVSEKGGEVPLSTVHWVLALNRQVVLGEKLDQSVQAQVVGMVLSHRLGMGLGVFNTVQAAGEKVAQWTSSLVSGVAGLVTGWCQQEAAPEEVPETPGIFRSVRPDREESVEKPWRKANSFGFYLDDFGPEDEPEAPPTNKPL